MFSNTEVRYIITSPIPMMQLSTLQMPIIGSSPNSSRVTSSSQANKCSVGQLVPGLVVMGET